MQHASGCTSCRSPTQPPRTPPPRRARLETSSRQPFNAWRAATHGSTWTEAEGGPEQLLVEWALTVDLTVVAQHQPEGQSAPDIADQLIMASGVPTLMLPPQAATELGGDDPGWMERLARGHACRPRGAAVSRPRPTGGGVRGRRGRHQQSRRGGRDAAATWRASGAGSDGRAGSSGCLRSSSARRGPMAPICWSSAAMATRAGASCSSAESRSTCCARHRFLSCSAADAWQRREADHDGRLL